MIFLNSPKDNSLDKFCALWNKQENKHYKYNQKYLKVLKSVITTVKVSSRFISMIQLLTSKHGKYWHSLRQCGKKSHGMFSNNTISINKDMLTSSHTHLYHKQTKKYNHLCFYKKMTSKYEEIMYKHTTKNLLICM